MAAGSNEEHPSLACAVQQRIQIGLRESAALRHTLIYGVLKRGRSQAATRRGLVLLEIFCLRGNPGSK